jgi:uncharacterized protein YciW
VTRYRHVLSKHLLRRTAREEQDRLRALQHTVQVAGGPVRTAALAGLRAAGITASDHVLVGRAGRIRARWVTYVRRP